MNACGFYEFFELFIINFVAQFAHKGNKIARIDKICASKFIKKL